MIDWGEQVVAGRRLYVFCAVLAWSRFRFVRFAGDQKAATTLAMLAECFRDPRRVPKVVLADRMGGLKGGVWLPTSSSRRRTMSDSPPISPDLSPAGRMLL